jgi:tRNA nucleotidyltransferase (CCA-adding enzyme)
MVANGELDHLVAERVWQELARGLMEDRRRGCSKSCANAAPWPGCCRSSTAALRVPQRAEMHPEVDTGCM